MQKIEQAQLTVCAPLPIDAKWRLLRENEVERLIAQLQNPSRVEIKNALDETGIIHFMSLHLIRGNSENEASFLLMELVADGQKDEVYSSVCQAIGEFLFPVFAKAFDLKKPETLKEFFRRNDRNIRPELFMGTLGLPFYGFRFLSVKRIRNEAKNVEQIRSAVIRHECEYVGRQQGSHQRMGRETAFEILTKTRSEIGPLETNGELHDVEIEEDLPFADRRDAPWLRPKSGSLARLARLAWKVPGIRMVGTIMLLICTVSAFISFDIPTFSVPAKIVFFIAILVSLLLTVLLATLSVAYLLLRRSEKANQPNDTDLDPHHVSELLRRENTPGFVQNHMISVTHLIKGPFRRFVTLPLALQTVGMAIAHGQFRLGFLSEIGTIFFARWIVLPGTRKLVFLSNYTGSWESYLEDFITKAAPGLTGIWSNCIGFPKTRLLFMEGAHDGDRFKRWARRSMQPTLFWYSAYPQLSAARIRTNALICDGYRRIKTPSDAEAWLELFDSIPRPESALERDEIQNLVFGGLKHLKYAYCVLIKFATKKDAQEWVGKIRDEISFGDKIPKDFAAYVAFSPTGLSKLGLADQVNRKKRIANGVPEKDGNGISFASPFVLGMDDVSRTRILGDVGNTNAPRQWLWGNRKTPVDSALLLYGLDEAIVNAKLQDLTNDKGVEVQECIEMTSEGTGAGGTGPVREHFGFADGISQPQIRGLKNLRTNPIHLVEAGEFVLGYRDNRNYFPPSPFVPAELDQNNFLPAPPAAMPKRYPRFSESSEGKDDSVRDFGRNGSYLVIRQLEQDVEKFNEWLNAKSKDEGLDIDKLAAKVCGRWMDGASLVKHPEQSNSELDNDFEFGRDDPQGLRCPLGAHIRRANPRDSFNPQGKAEIEVANRHRLLRRGRTYRHEGKKGVLFMCLNADIERQFEFVQQNWINSTTFHGLTDEVDPIAGHSDPGYFSMPTDTVPTRFERLDPFVSVRGGGYFFMPSRSALRFLATSNSMPPK